MQKDENTQKKFLHLSIKICDNSLGNFDKSKILVEEEYDINEKVYVFLKNNNRIISDKEQGSKEDNEILLFCARPINEEYIQLENNLNKNSLKLTEERVNSLNYKLWYVIKSYPEENENNINTNIEDNINEDYYLCRNDIIRLGNFKFFLKEIHLKNYSNDFFTTYKNNLKYDIHDINKNNNPVFEFIPKLDFYILEENKNIICSICNKSFCDINNPIVSLCDCDSYKYKHYECLKNDFKQQLKIIQNKKKTSTNYILKCHCYNCKTQIPLSFEIEGVNKIYELIDFGKPKEKDYLFFESLEYSTNFGDYEKSFHLIELNNDDNNDIIEISIGRDGSIERHRDNDIKIFESSVSRGKHAVIEYDTKKGTLLLKNKSSRSDSLIAIKEVLKINRNKIHLQIGRAFIEACLLNENEIKEIKYIKTRKQYENEIKENTHIISEEEKAEIIGDYFYYTGKTY